MNPNDIDPRFAEAHYQHDLKVRPWEQPRADSIQPADPDAKPGPVLPPLDIDLDEMRRQMQRERSRDIALVVMAAGLVLMWGMLLVSMSR